YVQLLDLPILEFGLHHSLSPIRVSWPFFLLQKQGPLVGRVLLHWSTFHFHCCCFHYHCLPFSHSYYVNYSISIAPWDFRPRLTRTLTYSAIAPASILKTLGSSINSL